MPSSSSENNSSSASSANSKSGKTTKQKALLGTAEEQGLLTEDDLRELAKWQLNGREIKNAIKTVRTWCLCKGFEMSLVRLEAGVKVTAPQAKKVEDGGL